MKTMRRGDFKSAPMLFQDKHLIILGFACDKFSVIRNVEVMLFQIPSVKIFL